ncbi:MAG: hypothetical protein KC492_23885 [Myxococcales bacterium]|nr:hypothetical protein [Myxococcales bacterium]
MTSTSPRRHLAAVSVTIVVTYVATVLLIFYYRTALRATATVSEPTVSAWLYTPYLAPGDSLRVQVVVYGGYENALERVTVRAGTQQRVIALPLPKSWLKRRTARRVPARSAHEFSLSVPGDHKPGTPFPLILSVRFLENQFSSSAQRLQVRAVTETLRLDVPVVKAGQRTLSRALAALKALGFLVMACLLVSWYARSLGASIVLMARRSSAMASFLATWLLALPLPLAFAGYVAFALPLVHATGWTSGWSIGGMLALWLIAPAIAAWRAIRVAPLEPMETADA